jgi:hypothetical protein
MIKFKTITPVVFPSIDKGPFNPLKLLSLDWTVTYDNLSKKAYATFKGNNRKITLWEGEDYDKIGQFTDTDVEARVIELMGIKQKDILQADTNENKQDPQPTINPVPQGRGFIDTIKSMFGLS